jgi:hypothetical protein
MGCFRRGGIMVEKIVYNVMMVTLLSCWVGANYFVAKCDDEDSDYILMVQQSLFQTMCLIALLSHHLFFK